MALGLGSALACQSDDRPTRIRASQAQWRSELGAKFPPAEVYFRAFKREALSEVWIAEKAGAPMRLLRTYRIAGASGDLGPKRREGDRQVPEGFYWIDRFNAKSQFHLSLGINYPNASDRVRSDRQRPGGDIFIHGDTKSIGCLAMTDPIIEEIYGIALSARSRRIHVHIFPGRMDDSGWNWLKRRSPSLVPFWSELRPGFLRFEATKRPPVPRIDARTGAYRF